MRLIKILLFIYFGFPVFSNAQPGSTRLYCDVSITFTNCTNKQINFKYIDSIHLKKDNYGLTCYLINIDNKEIPIKFREFKSLLSTFQIKKDGRLRIYYNFKSKTGTSIFEKSIIKIVFSKKKKTMIIYVDYTNLDKDIITSNIIIPFQEGTFKVTNPYAPKLIVVKEDDYK